MSEHVPEAPGEKQQAEAELRALRGGESAALGELKKHAMALVAIFDGKKSPNRELVEALNGMEDALEALAAPDGRSLFQMALDSPPIPADAPVKGWAIVLDDGTVCGIVHTQSHGEAWIEEYTRQGKAATLKPLGFIPDPSEWVGTRCPTCGCDTGCVCYEECPDCDHIPGDPKTRASAPESPVEGTDV